MSYHSEKTLLRKQIRTSLSALSVETRQRSDRALFRQLYDCSQFRSAQTLLLFFGIGTEPDTAPLLLSLLREGRRVVLPRVQTKDRMELRLASGLDRLCPGAFRIPEPDDSCPLISPSEVEFALIPALCYDTGCYRLGQGGGYYDRFLSCYTGFSLGLCRDTVFRSALPIEPHDRPVCLVLTETRSFESAMARRDTQ